MTLRTRYLAGAALFLFFACACAAPAAEAKGGEYKQIVRHLKTKYQAKKRKIPFLWLARFAVSVARPAGVKSFSVTIFEDLKFSKETLDTEMQAAMRESFGAEWNSILRIRSRTGEQIYMYMREAGKDSVKISLVTIDKEQATVIRATINPDKLAEFMNNPKIFGISLDDDQQEALNRRESAAPEDADKDKDRNEAKDDAKEN